MKYCFFLLFLGVAMTGYTQKRYTVEKSEVTFFSDGVIEDIQANNQTVTSIFDGGRGDIAFLIRIRDFQFEKKLMQVHFNEKFLDSEKFPKSTFIGVVSGFNPDKSGLQQVVAVGKLFMHGVTREIKVPGTIELKDSKLHLKASFMVKLLDYNITIPQIVWQNIAEDVEVKLDFIYRPL